MPTSTKVDDISPRWGVCHVCKVEKLIKYCRICEHWFCTSCRRQLFARSLDALLDILGANKDTVCCGPDPSTVVNT
jgi:hypothetical protein